MDLLVAYAGAIDYTATTDESLFVVLLPTVGALCAVGSSSWWAPSVWPALRTICLRYEAAFFQPSKRGPSSMWLATPAFRALFELVQGLLNGDDAAVRSYVAGLLTIPTFASRVDHGALVPELLEAWDAISQVGEDALPPSPSPAASSLVWLLSNVSSILHSALLSPSSYNAASSSVRALLLERGGLGTITALLGAAPPGLVSEQGLISLRTQGAATTTLSVDAQVTAAARLILQEGFVRRMAATTLLRPSTEEGAETAGLKVGREYMNTEWIWVYITSRRQSNPTAHPTTQALERPEDLRAVSRGGAAALDLTFAAHEAHRAQREAPLLSRVARRVGSFFGWGNGGGERQQAEEEDDDEDDGAMGVDDVPEHGAEDGAAGAAASVEELVGLEPLVHFLATALWKCHAADALSPASSLGNSVKRSILSTLAFPQGGASIRRLWLHLLVHHGAVGMLVCRA